MKESSLSDWVEANRKWKRENKMKEFIARQGQLTEDGEVVDLGKMMDAYRPVSVVSAVQIMEKFRLCLPWIAMYGESGDWLVDMGEVYSGEAHRHVCVIRDEVFSRDYQRYIQGG